MMWKRRARARGGCAGDVGGPPGAGVGGGKEGRGCTHYLQNNESNKGTECSMFKWQVATDSRYPIADSCDISSQDGARSGENSYHSIPPVAVG
eukprot:scaffold163483_cov39-Tisochrysis_lutea.AAC.1